MEKYLQVWAPLAGSMVVTALVVVFAWFAMQSTAPLRDALAGKGAVDQVAAADGGSAAGEFAGQARALLLGIVAVVILVSATRLALRVRRAHREAIVAAELRDLGGTVLYDFQVPEARRRRLSRIGRLTVGLLAPGVPEHYLGRIVSIDLEGSEAGDEHISLIRDCQQLEALDLSDTQISVSALSELSRLARLETLVLRNLEFSDADVPVLVSLRRLRRLDVSGCVISQTATSALESLPRLSLVQQETTPAQNTF